MTSHYHAADLPWSLYGKSKSNYSVNGVCAIWSEAGGVDKAKLLLGRTETS